MASWKTLLWQSLLTVTVVVVSVAYLKWDFDAQRERSDRAAIEQSRFHTKARGGPDTRNGNNRSERERATRRGQRTAGSVHRCVPRDSRARKVAKRSGRGSSSKGQGSAGSAEVEVMQLSVGVLARDAHAKRKIDPSEFGTGSRRQRLRYRYSRIYLSNS